MSDVLLTGERLQPGSQLFGVDLARHRAAYVYAIRNAGGKRLLDLGCGTGYGTAELANATPPELAVFGLDRVTPAATSRGPNANFLRADLGGIPLADASFSTIVSFQVIEHLDDPGPYLDAMSRLARPHGTVLITTPNVLTSDRVNPFHVHEYESRELSRLLEPHFETVEMRGIGMTAPVRAYNDARLARIRSIMRLDFLKLHQRLPRSVVEWAFGTLAKVVRRGIQHDEGLPDVSERDFPIGAPADDDIDLLAICRTPRTAKG